MRKLIVLISILALIAFAGCAFAASGGHVNPDAQVNKKPAVKYVPTEVKVDQPGAKVSVEETDEGTPDDFSVANIYLPTDTSNRVSVMNNVKIKVEDYDPNFPMTITLGGYKDTRTDDLYAFMQAKKDEGDYKTGKFYAFECTVNGEDLSFTVDLPGAFFSDTTVTLATVDTVPSGGGGGGGCSTGYAGLLLLAAVPLFFRKKK